MPNAIHREAARRLLQAMHTPNGPSYSHSFIFGRPGSRPHEQRLGVSLVYPQREVIRAAHFVRQNGPAYLKYLDLNDVWKLLTDFVSDNYWVLQCWPPRFSGSYVEHVSDVSKAAWEAALEQSQVFTPHSETTLFPLVSIQLDFDFTGTNFFLCAPENLKGHLDGLHPERWLAPDIFPPTQDARDRAKRPTSWLGVAAPTVSIAKKMRAGVLGAVALTPEPSIRHTFSMRENFGGYCTINETSVAHSSGRPHAPSMMDNVILTGDDHSWLAETDRLLGSPTRDDRRKLYALEYFYRAWPLDAAARFPIHCMALDGVFGDANEATAAVVRGVRETLGDHIEPARLGDLMSLRASVIHGGAPDVYDSRKYARYYENFSADPVFDLGLVVAECLRSRIFGGRMSTYKNPGRSFFADLKAKGHILPDRYEDTILRPNDPDNLGAF